MIDLVVLKADILTNHADLAAAGNMDVIASVYETIDSAILIERGVIDRNHFITPLVQAIGFLLSLDAANPLRAPFNAWLELLKITDYIDTRLPDVHAVLDNLKGSLDQAHASNAQVPTISQATIDAIKFRPGTRTEFLFGAGASITYVDAANALHSGGA